MLKIRETIIVEGKYDKIKLTGIVDANIISTNGFSIFTDEPLKETIRLCAKKNGIVILTDSDRAGFMIRNYVKNIVKDGIVKHAYIPSVQGRERRKDKASKEGFLGVEGIDDEIIIQALKKADLHIPDKDEDRIEKSDLYLLGLSGTDLSAELRRQICLYLNLPPRISANALLDVLNAVYTKDEFTNVLEEFKNQYPKKG